MSGWDGRPESPRSTDKHEHRRRSSLLRTWTWGLSQQAQQGPTAWHPRGPTVEGGTVPPVPILVLLPTARRDLGP